MFIILYCVVLRLKWGISTMRLHLYMIPRSIQVYIFNLGRPNLLSVNRWNNKKRPILMTLCEVSVNIWLLLTHCQLNVRMESMMVNWYLDWLKYINNRMRKGAYFASSVDVARMISLPLYLRLTKSESCEPWGNAAGKMCILIKYLCPSTNISLN